MNQFIFECIELASVDEEANIQVVSTCEPQRDIPWDDPYPYYVGMIPGPLEDAVVDAFNEQNAKSQLNIENESTLKNGQK